jgi:hypothetical protein
MSAFAQLSAFFRRRGNSATIHPEAWPEPSGKPRVLIENPDGADLWAHAEILRDAGYDVAMCAGPSDAVPAEHQERTVCPLIAEGQCPLVEGADVVVSTTYLTDGREILATLSARGSPALVVEGTGDDLERNSDVIGDAVRVRYPLSAEQIVGAVERARSPRAGD